MKEKVIDTIKKYNLIDAGDIIVIGVSGGPDSMCLLHILNSLRQSLDFEIVVAHINHMIREDAESETQFVQEYCNKIGVECYIQRINVIEKSNLEKIGTEEAGRKARYDFFEKVLKDTGANKIATAHNANDNAETILMNIFRGTGISGLRGIEPIRDNKYIRPIIECERFEIENYCNENNLEPKIDKTNFENTYTRNKIRNILIPELKKEFNPNIIQALNKLSSLARQENEFIQNYVENITEKDLKVPELMAINKEALEQIADNQKLENIQYVLDLKKFNALENFIKSKVILYVIQKVLGSTQGIEKVHIDDIIKLCSKNVGNKFLMPNKKIKVLVKSGKIYFFFITKKV